MQDNILIQLNMCEQCNIENLTASKFIFTCNVENIVESELIFILWKQVKGKVEVTLEKEGMVFLG